MPRWKGSAEQQGTTNNYPFSLFPWLTPPSRSANTTKPRFENLNLTSVQTLAAIVFRSRRGFNVLEPMMLRTPTRIRT